MIKMEIIQYLQSSEIYITPYTGKDKAVSGTMAYAVGYGKVIVSTPYLDVIETPPQFVCSDTGSSKEGRGSWTEVDAIYIMTFKITYEDICHTIGKPILKRQWWDDVEVEVYIEC